MSSLSLSFNRRAYSQLLESYKSVQLASMANDFGVNVEYIDRFVSPFLVHLFSSSDL